MVEKVEGRIGKNGTVCEKQTENSRVLILAKFLRGRSLSLSLLAFHRKNRKASRCKDDSI